jgi:uncharacterized membrane protein
MMYDVLPARRRTRAVLSLFLFPVGMWGCGDATEPRSPAFLGFAAEALQLERMESVRVELIAFDQQGRPFTEIPAGLRVTWSSSDERVATVDGGTITGVSAGRARVTAGASGLEPAHVEVLVSDAAFDVVVLGVLGGERSNGWGVNGAGAVAGWASWSQTRPEEGRAFLWSEAGGLRELLGVESGVRGMNDAGVVVGYQRSAAGDRAYVVTTAGRVDLQPLVPGQETFASGINASGVVVGRSDQQAVVWRPGPDGAYGAAVAIGSAVANYSPVINGRGDVAFSPPQPAGRPRVWRAREGGGFEDPVSLGASADTNYWVRGMNSAGLVVGFGLRGGAVRAFLWHPNDYATPIDLGILGEAWAINERNEIVGTEGGQLPVFGGQARTPVIWRVDPAGSVSQPLRLKLPTGFDSGGARSISSAGWVAGSVWGPGQVRAAVWKPR